MGYKRFKFFLIAQPCCREHGEAISGRSGSRVKPASSTRSSADPANLTSLLLPSSFNNAGKRFMLENALKKLVKTNLIYK